MKLKSKRISRCSNCDVGQPFQAAGEPGFSARRPSGGWKAALTGRLESLHLRPSAPSPRARAWTMALSLVVFNYASSADTSPPNPTTVLSVQTSNHTDAGKSPKHEEIVIERVENEADNRPAKLKDFAWLGVGTKEASEELSAQLKLSAGQGLVVTFIAPDSPAAKIGLQKNDVLAQLGGQLMVDSRQLRKLVQMRKPGDAIQLELFRAGKRMDLSVTLGKTSTSVGLLRDERSWHGDLQELNELHLPELEEGMHHMRESFTSMGPDGQALKIQIQRKIEEATKAAEEALRRAGTQGQGSEESAKLLEDLARSKADLDKSSTVIVNRKGHSVQTQVKSDDSGTYIVIASPKKRLTAHDRHGKLLFDGEIESAEQRARVPRAVWKIVEPMLEQMNDHSPADDK